MTTIAITDNTLSVDGTDIELPRLSEESAVVVWSVPVEYRTNGYFVGIKRSGVPLEVPACDPREATKLGEAEYPADQGAMLDAEKSRKHAERVAALESAREAGFTHNGVTVASDEKSQGLFNALNTEAGLAILSGTQEALDAFAAGLGDGWRALDGTIVATDATSFRAMMQSWYAHVAATDAVSQGHKTMIDAAADLAELQAINVTAGY